MTQEIIEMAQECGLIGMRPHLDGIYSEALVAFAKLVAAKEREAIAQMIEEAPELVQFAQNDKGGCMVCGFTPKLATQSIRARGEQA